MSCVSRVPFVLALVLALGLVACEPAPEPDAPVPAAEQAAEFVASGGDPCPEPHPDSTYSNVPFERTDCWTTEYGPARADVVPDSSAMLYCDVGTYALCFFSGPATPTGTAPTNRPLPCTLSEDGTVADCTCQAYTASADEPMYVAITSILNEGVYLETVQACGPNGDRCKSLATCDADPTSPECRARRTAPVCEYVAGQDRTDPGASLIPGADLISTFSFAMEESYDYAKIPTLCMTPQRVGLYAGCMTAPCRALGDGPLRDGEPVECACPTFDGPFQVGQPGQSCELADRHVWSASYTPSASGP